jgi:hypothetical protein
MLLLLSGAICAQESFRPAHFGFEDEERQLLNRIRFPEIKGDVSVMLLCFSQLEPSGKMDQTGCMMKDQFDAPFASAVSEAGKKARMAPAEIDGDKVKVYVQFRVEFVAKGEDHTIRVILNPGYQENIDAYGEEHVAAQRLIGGKEYWQDVCPQRARYAVLAKAYVGEDGRSDSPSVEHAAGVMPTATCQTAIMDSILASRYVPAMADGLPVPSTFVELFSN